MDEGNNRLVKLWNNQIAKKEEELARVELQLEEATLLNDQSKFLTTAERLAKEIDKLYGKLSDLDNCQSNHNKLKLSGERISTPNSLYLNFEQNLSEIDFKQARKKINQFIENLREEGIKENTLFLLQDSFSMKGDILIEEIREKLNRKTNDFKHLKCEFVSTAGCLDKIGVLLKLSEYLNIEPVQDINIGKVEAEREYLNRIIETIYRSIQGGSIVFFEFRKWDALVSPEETSEWFIKQFWIPLIKQLEEVTRTYRQVRLICLIVAEAKLSSQCVNILAPTPTGSNVKTIKIPLGKWKINDIKFWLESYLGYTDCESNNTAKHIHKVTKGTPLEVCIKLEEEWKRKK